MRLRLPALAALAFATPIAAALPVQKVDVVNAYPHDRRAFTEGLFFRDGFFYESTGLEGRSEIRQVRIADGKVIRSIALPPRLFGEGIVDWGNELISLTWQTGVGFRWSLPGLAKRGEFRYPGEGWGLTRSPREIVMSDGTPYLRFLDPKTLKIRRRVQVTAEGSPIKNINELEWVRGEIYANIWYTSLIARIDPATGKVKGWIDITPLAEKNMSSSEAVANGIAYDAKRGRLFVTGKNWPMLYEVRLKPAGAP